LLNEAGDPVSFRPLAWVAPDRPGLSGEQDANHSTEDRVSPHGSLRERRALETEWSAILLTVEATGRNILFAPSAAERQGSVAGPAA
jgi:hypothetical protein